MSRVRGPQRACPYCGKMHRADARFCSRTGRNLPPQEPNPRRDNYKTESVRVITAHCPNCGEVLLSGRKARFCNHCGFELVSYRRDIAGSTRSDETPVKHLCPYPDCENPLTDEMRYCSECYRRVRFCDGCRKYLVPGGSACSHCGAKVPLDPGNWPMFKGDPGRSGCTPDVLSPDLKLCWSYPDTRKAERILASPVVHNGIIYYGSCNKHLHALNQYSGELIWKKPTNGNILSTPAITNGVIFIASCDGRIYAQEAMKGKPLWAYPPDREENLGEISAPLLACPAGVVAVSDAGQVICLDEKGGGFKWSTLIRELDVGDSAVETTGLAPGPAFCDWKIFVPGKNGRLYCLDANDGTILWSFPGDGPVESCFVSTPSVSAGQCFIPDRSGKFYSVDEKKGFDSWQFTVDLDGVVEGSPSIGFGSIIVGTGTQHVISLNMHAGGENWRRRNTRIRLVDSIFSTPVITGNRLIFIGSNSGYVYCRDLETGEELWKYRLDSPIRTSPVVSDGFLYVATTRGILYAFCSSRGVR